MYVCVIPSGCCLVFLLESHALEMLQRKPKQTPTVWNMKSSQYAKPYELESCHEYQVVLGTLASLLKALQTFHHI